MNKLSFELDSEWLPSPNKRPDITEEEINSFWEGLESPNLFTNKTASKAASPSPADPLEAPPEIGDWLIGCYKLEPDGTVTEAMDLNLETFW